MHRMPRRQHCLAGLQTERRSHAHVSSQAQGAARMLHRAGALEEWRSGTGVSPTVGHSGIGYSSPKLGARAWKALALLVVGE